MFKRIHKVFTCHDSPAIAPYNGNLHIEVHCPLIEPENEKIKLALYLVLLIDLLDLDG